MAEKAIIGIFIMAVLLLSIGGSPTGDLDRQDNERGGINDEDFNDRNNGDLDKNKGDKDNLDRDNRDRDNRDRDNRDRDNRDRDNRDIDNRDRDNRDRDNRDRDNRDRDNRDIDNRDRDNRDRDNRDRDNRDRDNREGREYNPNGIRNFNCDIWVTYSQQENTINIYIEMICPSSLVEIPIEHPHYVICEGLFEDIDWDCDVNNSTTNYTCDDDPLTDDCYEEEPEIHPCNLPNAANCED